MKNLKQHRRSKKESLNQIYLASRIYQGHPSRAHLATCSFSQVSLFIQPSTVCCFRALFNPHEHDQQTFLTISLNFSL